MHFSAVGGTPIGMSDGSICYTGPQLVSMILAAVLVVPVTPNTCQKCYQTIRYGLQQLYTFTAHTHINKVCYDQKNLEVCQYGGQEYWVGENLGKGGIRLGLSCPRGEQWLCFTKARHWDISDGGGVQDMVKEEIVKNVTRHLIEQGRQREQDTRNNMYIQI